MISERTTLSSAGPNQETEGHSAVNIAKKNTILEKVLDNLIKSIHLSNEAQQHIVKDTKGPKLSAVRMTYVTLTNEGTV